MLLEPEPQDPSGQAVQQGRSVQVVRQDRRGRQAPPEARLVPRGQLAHKARQDHRAVLRARPDPSVRLDHKGLLDRLEPRGQVAHREPKVTWDQLEVRQAQPVRVEPLDPQDLPEGLQGRAARLGQRGRAVQQDRVDQSALMVLAEDSVQLVPLVQLVRKGNPALPEGRQVRLVRSVHRAFRALPAARLGLRVRLVRLVQLLRGTTLEHSTSESVTPSEIWRPIREAYGIGKTLTAETWETYRAPSRIFGIS